MVDIQTDNTPEGEVSADEETTANAAIEAANRLSTAIETMRPDLAEPDEDELDEEIVFVRNGWIRVTIAGKLHKLRRPFLGELKDLDLSREADQEALNQKSQEMRERTDGLLARAQEVEGLASKEGLTPEETTRLNIEATQLAQKAHAESRALVREAHQVRAGWWKQAFSILTPPGYDPPEDMPAWIGDLTLQQRAIAHWQMVPLALGGQKGGKVSPIR